MIPVEFKRRQVAATQRLLKAGKLVQACEWLRKNPPPKSWRGTPLEYAEEEAPVFGPLETLKRIFK